jgi:phosphopantothenoylcysteine synthetase/decarboxylase
VLEKKNLDLAVANSPAAIGAGESAVVIVKKRGERRLPRMPKAVVAEAVLDEVSALLQADKKS